MSSTHSSECSNVTLRLCVFFRRHPSESEVGYGSRYCGRRLRFRLSLHRRNLAALDPLHRHHLCGAALPGWFELALHTFQPCDLPGPERPSECGDVITSTHVSRSGGQQAGYRIERALMEGGKGGSNPSASSSRFSVGRDFNFSDFDLHLDHLLGFGTQATAAEHHKQ